MKIWSKNEIIEFLKTAKDWLYICKLHKRKRSIPQNSYLNLIFQFIADFWNTWYSQEEIKEILKAKYLRTYSEKFKTAYIKPTKELNSKEMTDFIEKIRIWSVEFLELEIPDPDEKRMLDYYNNHI